MKVKEDIFSTKRILIAAKGTPISLIAEHGEVWIVENVKTKERFSIQKNNVDI